VIAAIYFPNIRAYFQKIWIVSFVAVFILAVLAGILVGFFSGDSWELTIKNSILRGFPIIAAFYIFVAWLEEILKHLGVYSYRLLSTDTRKEILLVSVYIALGFVFLENMLYLSGIYNRSGFDSSFFWLLFSRSLVSLLLHVFATLLLTVGFYAWFKNASKDTGMVYVKYFLLALFAHAAFNIALTYNATWVLPLYAIVGYFFLTSIFFQEDASIISCMD
jgi:RsiW-degrading membrane proteinase PrsW (M82 family)